MDIQSSRDSSTPRSHKLPLSRQAKYIGVAVGVLVSALLMSMAYTIHVHDARADVPLLAPAAVSEEQQHSGAARSVSVDDGNASSSQSVSTANASVPEEGAQAGKSEYVPNQLLVRFKEGISVAEQEAVFAKIGAVSHKLISKSTGTVLIVLPEKASVTSVQQEISRLPEVQSAEPDYIYHTQTIPNDAQFTQLWGMHNTGQSGGVADIDINGPEGWDSYTGNRSSVVVAVIDTGIDYTHPDLTNNMWRNPGEVAGNGVDDDHNGYVDDVYGIDVVNNDTNPMDDHYHGTHCAGTIAGEGNNGIGVAGVAWQAKVMACKFLDSGGSGSTSGAITCLDYLRDLKVNHNIDLVLSSNSWGGGGYSATLEAAIAANRDAGILFVAAAGNNSSNNDSTPNYPSNYNVANIVAVAAIDRAGALASFSNYGATTVDVGAPGVDVYSTKPGNTYGLLSGTSMATPHISGMLALYKMDQPNLTWQELIQKLYANGRSLASLSGRTVTGKLPKLELWGPDTDGDGMPSTWETRYGLNPTNPADGSSDLDADGLSNLNEWLRRTLPNNVDTDADGLQDGAEVNTHSTDPLKADTDADGLNDGVEVSTHHTNPTLADTDADGLSDGAEINTRHTNPLSNDTDGDGMRDGWEVQYGLNPLVNDSVGDPDGDGLGNVEESQAGSSPFDTDTDDDSLSDYAEWRVHHTSPILADTDSDTLGDAAEINTHHTNPLSNDSDSDMLPDGWEVTYGTNPLLDDRYADPDRDGRTNLQEYTDKTNPLVAEIPDREPNDTLATAQNVDGFFTRNYSADIGDASTNTSTTIPHVTILGTGNGSYDYFSFTVLQPGIAIFDIDYGSSDASSFDSYLTLFSSSGTVLASNDDANTLYGQAGSVSGLDSFMTYNFTQAGTYIIEVGSCCKGTLPVVAGYSLQLSVQHPFMDSDQDGMPDSWETQYSFNPNNAADAAQDADADGLSNLQEFTAKTHPRNADSDADGLSDGQEVLHYATNPLVADTDTDGLSDGVEVNTHHTSPTSIDSDSDGMPDGWEVTHTLNPLSAADAIQDADGDGWTNAQEFTGNSNPRNVSSRPGAGAGGGNSKVGYYNLNGAGVSGQASVITANGMIPEQITNIATHPLENNLGILLVDNPSGSYASNYVSQLPRISSYIQNGGVLIFHDRTVTGAQTVLPGSAGTFTYASQNNLAVLSVDADFANGPGGLITDSTLDVGSSSTHGYVTSSTTPAGSVGLLSIQGVSAQWVTYYYKYGAGYVVYSAIPLDCYLLGGNCANLAGAPAFRDIYARNILNFAYRKLSTLPDVDADGMPDAWEDQYGLNKNSAADALTDKDGDGLINLQEYLNKGNPNVQDTDADGLNDYQEAFGHRTKVDVADSDADGLNDGLEINTHHTNALDRDTDHDGMRDGWEVQYGLNPLNASDASGDNDGDGVSNTIEALANTNPASAASKPAAGQLLWNATVGTSSDSAPVLAEDGTVYVASQQGYLRAYNFDGSEKWAYNTGSVITQSAPVVGADGTVYVGTDGNYLYAINPNGNLRWRFLAAGNLMGVSVSINDKGAIFFGDAAGHFYALNADGTLQWSYYYGGSFAYSKPAIGEELIAVNNYSRNEVVAFDPDGNVGASKLGVMGGTGGALMWRYGFLGQVMSQPIIGEDDRVYVGSSDGYLNALDKVGDLLWRHNAGVVVGSMALDEDGNIYVGSRNNALYSVTPAGVRRWSYAAGGYVDSSPAIGVNGTIFVGGDDNYLHAVNANGSLKWKYATGNDVNVAPVVSDAGIVYAASLDGKLYAVYDGATGLMNSQWPMYGVNQRHSGLGAVCDAQSRDSDLDEIPDCWERKYGMDPADPLDADFDLDGDILSNLQEFTFATNPLDTDSDDDGLNDGQEVFVYFTNPATADTDADQLDDRAEVLVWFTNALIPDSDGDGLFDGTEVNLHHSNPLLMDSDADGMPDGYEVSKTLNPVLDDSAADADSDELTNLAEYLLGTSPVDNDSDDDGMPDGYEVSVSHNPLSETDADQDPDADGLSNLNEYLHHADPVNADTDADTLLDGAEVYTYGTNPADADTDNDGLSDGYEIDSSLTSPLAVDTDGDGLSDGEEVLTHHTNPLAVDSDGDTLGDGEELGFHHTNPLSADSDGDGMTDDYELANNLNPNSDDRNLDPDSDGLKNGEESALGTNPHLADSDGDSLSDGLEVRTLHTNPLAVDSDRDTLSDNWELTHGESATQARYSVQVASDGHVCALTDSGVQCWGNNAAGQASVPALTAPSHVVVGEAFSCALDTGAWICWGDVDSDDRATVPAIVGELREVAVGERHGCLIDGAGLRCWGEDGEGQASVPAGIIKPQGLATGAQHSCVIDGNDAVCWGDNTFAQLDAPALSKPVLLAAGDRHTCAYDLDLGVVCWGDSSQDQAGIVGLTGVQSLAASAANTCAVHAGQVSCWGSNESAQLDVPMLNNAAAVDVSAGTVCALDAAGVHCWGNHADGQDEVIAWFDTDGDGMSNAYELQYGFDRLEASDASPDVDGDGLSNLQESVQNTNPHSLDSDADGLPDFYEANHGTQPAVADASDDPDGDSFTNAQEYAAGTEPLDADSDDDGLPDGYENEYGQNPLLNDADVDQDADGLTGLEEFALGSNPVVPDTDGDGMLDGFEVANGLDPLADDAIADSDSDGFSNLGEFLAGTDPNNADTDGDGLSDGYEHDNALNPLLDDAGIDSDADGLTALQEFTAGTHVADADSDDDGLNDGQEVASLLTNPLDRDSDHDLIPDGFEYYHSLNPLDASDALADQDADGMSNFAEYRLNLDLANPADAVGDIDNDGFSNAQELSAGSDPVVAQTHVSAGWYHTCVLDNAGVKCWGDNSKGQTAVPVLDLPIQVTAGLYHSCALDSAGVHCWGDNSKAQSAVPVLVNPVQVSAGAYHTCAIDDTGVVCWGDNANGQLTVPELELPRVVAAGNFHTCALDVAGVKCWGMNTYGQTTVPAVTGVFMLDTGSYNSCAISAAGAACWGYNAYAQSTPLPTGIVQPREMAGGNHHSCMVDGTQVKCWGRNDAGQTTVPAMVGARFVAAGNKHSCALDNDNLHCWGGNTNGQSNVPGNLWFDADHDGLPDGYEIQYGLNRLLASDAAGDLDGDGATNLQEYQFGLNPVVADTDADSLLDGDELARGTDPLLADTDGDTLTDGAEVAGGTDPLLADTDGDGADDLVDVFPLDAAEWADTDTDTVGDNADNCPAIANLDQLDTDADAEGNTCDLDDDSDGVADVDEVVLGTDPLLADTDGDGINDGADVFPLDSSESADSDADGIGNNADSDDDNDGVLDAQDSLPLVAYLDGSFDVDGKQTTVLPGGNIEIRAMVQASNGKLIGVGYQTSASTGNDGLVVRYNSDGTLDGSFAAGGYQRLVFSDEHDVLLAAAMQADDKIVAVGRICNWVVAGACADYNSLIVRFDVNGVLDATFGAGGVVSLDTAPQAYDELLNDVVVQADGKIVAAGGTCTVWAGTSCDDWDGLTIRLDSNGAIDPAFGIRIDYAPGVYNEWLGVAQQHDGKLVLSGHSGWHIGMDFNALLARMNPNGEYDLAFGLGGKQIVVSGDNASAGSIIEQEDGKLVIAGSSCFIGSECQLMAMRFTQDGVLDASFALGGVLLVDGSSSDSDFETVTKVLQLPDGKLLFAGYSIYDTLFTPDGDRRFVLMRINQDGTRDAGFNGNGLLTTTFAEGVAQAFTALRQQDGKLVLAGVLRSGASSGIALARYVITADSDGDGVLDQDDAFPFDPLETLDMDSDGVGNNADQDDDGDGVPDYIDGNPLDPAVGEVRLPLHSRYIGSSIRETGVGL